MVAKVLMLLLFSYDKQKSRAADCWVRAYLVLQLLFYISQAFVYSELD